MLQTNNSCSLNNFIIFLSHRNPLSCAKHPPSLSFESTLLRGVFASSDSYPNLLSQRRASPFHQATSCMHFELFIFNFIYLYLFVIVCFQVIYFLGFSAASYFLAIFLAVIIEMPVIALLRLGHPMRVI